VQKVALIAMLLLAGCGSAQDHSTSPPPPKPAANHVFTVPARLPPREHAARTGRTHAAPAPAAAPSDTEIEQELAHALGVKATGRVADQAGLSASGLATVPPSAPAKVAAIITAANQVARAPYRYGGGHGGVKGEEIWIDTAYDCSGSVSFALASAGLVSRQLDSTSLEHWGKPGPGHWVTVYANAGHAFMVVAGLRFDTVERARTGTRWGAAPSRVGGFVARHPAGL
jgi:cell wall-associated NlpC family hydrolase